MKARPAELAAELAQALQGVDGIADVEVSGPGFLNITVGDAGLWRQAGRRAADDRLGVGGSGQPVVVDYSAPNIAKEMHVGHLRTTVIGDSLVRVLGHLGATVIRQNHIGDWGTQFGMLIQYLDEHPARGGGTPILPPRVESGAPVSASTGCTGSPARSSIRRGVRRPVAGTGSSRCRPATEATVRAGANRRRVHSLPRDLRPARRAAEPGDSAGESVYNP